MAHRKRTSPAQESTGPRSSLQPASITTHPSSFSSSMSSDDVIDPKPTLSFFPLLQCTELNPGGKIDLTRKKKKKTGVIAAAIIGAEKAKPQRQAGRGIRFLW